MELKLAVPEDLASIMQIVHEAQVYLASLGTDQWQNGYPTEAVILEDISKLESYLAIDQDGEVLATAMLTTRAEPTYQVIEGAWLTNENHTYGVIHRMAVAAKKRGEGIAKFILIQSEAMLHAQQVGSMRIDTHEDNKGMQGLLVKSGYSYCGIIYLADGAKRLAYEKLTVV